MPRRLQLALNVNDIGEAVAFYSKLFGTELAKLRPGYANFAITEPPLKLVLLENPGRGGSLNHLGIEVPDTGMVGAERARLAGTGLASSDEGEATCCYARQDKFWVQGAPDGESWEIYTVLADSQTFYADGHGPECCGGTGQPAEPAVPRWRELLLAGLLAAGCAADLPGPLAPQGLLSGKLLSRRVLSAVLPCAPARRAPAGSRPRCHGARYR